MLKGAIFVAAGFLAASSDLALADTARNEGTNKDVIVHAPSHMNAEERLARACELTLLLVGEVRFAKVSTATRSTVTTLRDLVCQAPN